MNIEELELSLRSEFEAHLKRIFSDVERQVAEFQEKIDAEVGKHRTQMIEALNEFSTRATAERSIDKAFTETVAEHLRLARDDGARITAAAMVEAESIDDGTARSVSFNFARDAVNDISNQTTQSAILHALVQHAEQFAPRGVFFIVRNEHFVGWQAFGSESHADDGAVRDLNFAVDSDTVLNECVRSLKTVERVAGAGADESIYLNSLAFDNAQKMLAIPLVARGRGVAALYVDPGTKGRTVNVEALEMLVRVAGLTVELLASNQAARPQIAETERVPTAEVYSEPETESVPSYKPAAEYVETVAEPAQMEESGWQDAQFKASPEEDVDEYEVETVEATEVEAVEVGRFETSSGDELEQFESPAAEAEQIESAEEAASEPASEPESTTDFAFSSGAVEYEPTVQTFEHVDVAKTPANETSDLTRTEPAEIQTNGFADAGPSRRQTQTRKLDLPIEVNDDERGTHTKARRFARLLVSEIKLYNEDKVKQGRESCDLYERLKEAIDRSREMYDKRVEPPVSSKFDYFHYELVNDLAEGDPARLGSSYPGSAV